MAIRRARLKKAIAFTVVASSCVSSFCFPLSALSDDFSAFTNFHEFDPVLSEQKFNNIIENVTDGPDHDFGTIIQTDVIPEIMLPEISVTDGESEGGFRQSKPSRNGSRGLSSIPKVKEKKKTGGSKLANETIFAKPIALALMPGEPLKGVVELNDAGANASEPLIELRSGNAFLAPDTKIKVQTANSLITVGAGAEVLILQVENELAVLALHDERKDSIRVCCDGDAFNLPVGRQLVLSDGNPDFADLRSGKQGPIRSLSVGHLGHLKAFVSEFSYGSLFSNTHFFKELKISDKKNEQLALHRILKSAAALSVLTGSRGPFKAAKADSVSAN